MVSFTTIPAEIKTPGVFVEFDSSRALAGLPGQPHKALVIGTKSAGTVGLADTLYQIPTRGRADELFAPEAQITEMLHAFKDQNANTELWAIAVDEDVNQTKAAYELEVRGTATSSGTIYLYIGGYRFLVPVKLNDNASAIATAIAAEVTSRGRTPFTSIASGDSVIIEFNQFGSHGNYATPFINMKTGETLPTGISLGAVNTLTVTAAPTGNGNTTLSVGSTDITVNLVAATHTTTQLVASAIASAANTALSNTTITVSASTLTFFMPINQEFNFDLVFDGGSTGAAATAGIVTQKGAGEPDLTAAILAMGDNQFNTVVLPANDTGTTGAITAALLAKDAGDVMLDGVAFSAERGSVSELLTKGAQNNSPYLVMAGYPTSPDFPWVVAAKLAALDAAEPDPARPRQTLPLRGLVGTLPGRWQSRTERQSILNAGIATFTLGADGIVRADRIVTTYKTNAQGLEDATFRDITTMRTLSYLRWSWRAIVSSKYPRHKLADDGTLFAPGQPIVTPSLMKSEALAWFRDVENIGLLEDFEQFRDDLISERNATDRNRLDMQMTFNLVNGLIVFATKMQFIV